MATTKHYTLYVEIRKHRVTVSSGVHKEGDYTYEMEAVEDLTKTAKDLLAGGDNDSVWMHIWVDESNGRRDVKKWLLTKYAMPRKVGAHDQIIYPTEPEKKS